MTTEERKALKAILDLIRHLVSVGDTILDGNIGEHDVYSRGIVNEAYEIRCVLGDAVRELKERR